MCRRSFRAIGLVAAMVLATACAGADVDADVDGGVATTPATRPTAPATTASNATEPTTRPVDEPVAPAGRLPVSVRPVLGCGEASLTADADIVQVDPAQQADCALGPPITDGRVFSSDAAAVVDSAGGWSISVNISPHATDAWNAAAAECFEQGAGCPAGRLAIVANGAIVSAPTVDAPELPTEIVIAGTFTQLDAESIAAAINANG